MKFSYEDLISGDAIPVKGVGHLISPQLTKLKPTVGIGTFTYHLYLNVLTWDKESVIGFMKQSLGGKADELLNNEKITTFDIMTLFDYSIELLQNAMAFFMQEKLVWNKKNRGFATISKETDKVVGQITRENFEDVRDMMLQLNYINLGKDSNQMSFSSKKAEENWKRVQKYLKEEGNKKQGDKETSFGNIISKLCAANTGYTFSNIYDLTVFQLYDQFFQYGYLRNSALGEMAFSNHGGENFDIQGWLKPIIKI